MRKTGILFSLVVLSLPANSQTLTWKNLTSMYDVNDVTIQGGNVWAATMGGVFSYSIAAKSFKELTTTEGLSYIQATAIAVEKGSRILVGEANGAIDELDSAGNVLRTQHDIVASAALTKEVTNFYFTGDSIFASTQMGVILISYSTFQILNSYTHFVAAQNTNARGVAVFKNNIYVASDSGLSVAPRSGVNLSAPDLWRVNDTLGLSGGTSAVAVFNGALYAGTATGLYFSVDGANFQIVNGVTGKVLALNSQPAYLLVNMNGTLLKVDPSNNVSTIYSGGPGLTGVAPVSDSLFAAASSHGLVFLNQTAQTILPPGPATNIISTLAVDGAGNLWCSTQSDTTHIGVAFMEMKYGTAGWINFNQSSDPKLPSASTYFRISAVCGNQIFVGTWGNGLVLLTGDTISKVFNYQNSSLASSPGSNPAYVLAGDAVCDSHGDVWVTNPYAYNNNPLDAYSPQDTAWYSFNNPYSLSSGFAPIGIDAYGGVWTGDALSDIHGVYHGLFYYNANGTLSDRSDDISYLLTQSTGLISNHVSSISVDKENQVWVGTDLGLDLVYPADPTIPSSSPSITSIFSMLDQSVNSIDYDALDDKWVATNTGVYVLSRDGNTRLASYDVTNSPLPTDVVTAIACDRAHGVVYFATSFGIISLKTGVVEPNTNFSTLKIFPNPAKLPVRHSIQIQGLVANSHVKIFSVDGKLVDEFDAQGGKIAYWDGSDASGKLVPTGVYIVVAYSPDGSQSAVSKIAIVRQ
ncbi:MAG TPA: two-component regulator propeller domain-containing protein [Candidatus Kryptonia bacterium]